MSTDAMRGHGHDRGGRRGRGGLSVDRLARRERVDGRQPRGARSRQAGDRRPQLRAQSRRALAREPADPRDRPDRARRHHPVLRRPVLRGDRVGHQRPAQPVGLRPEPLHRERRPRRQDDELRPQRRRRRRDHRLAPHERHASSTGSRARCPSSTAAGRSRERERDYYVDVDNVRGGKDATTYLIERGHHRIATITGPLTMPAGVDRLRGYRDALAAHGLPEGIIEDGNFTADGGAAAMRRILDSVERPDAIFVASDLMARGALAVLARAGHPRSGRHRDHGLRRLAGRDIRHPAADHDASAVLRAGRADGDACCSTCSPGRHPRHVTILETELVVRDSV